MDDPKRKQIVDALVDAAIEDKRTGAAYQKALGSLAMNFSLLHFQLEMFSWDVFDVDHQAGQILTKDLPTSKLIEKLQSCCKRWAIPSEQRTQLSKLLNQIRKAAEERNELLHNLWFIDEGQPAFCYNLARGKGKVHSAPPVSDISDFARLVEMLFIKLVDFKHTASIRIPSFAAEGHPESIIPRRP